MLAACVTRSRERALAAILKSCVFWHFKIYDHLCEIAIADMHHFLQREWGRASQIDGNDERLASGPKLVIRRSDKLSVASVIGMDQTALAW
jgi:hypothetical protein